MPHDTPPFASVHIIPEFAPLDVHPHLTLGALAHDPATGTVGRVAGITYWDDGWVVGLVTTTGDRRYCPADGVLPGLPPEPPLLAVRLPWDVLRSMMKADRLNNNATEAERILLDALPKDVHDRLAAEIDVTGADLIRAKLAEVDQ